MKSQTNKNNDVYATILSIAKEGASIKRDCRCPFNIVSAATTLDCRTGRQRHVAARRKEGRTTYDRQGAYFSSK